MPSPFVSSWRSASLKDVVSFLDPVISKLASSENSSPSCQRISWPVSVTQIPGGSLNKRPSCIAPGPHPSHGGSGSPASNPPGSCGGGSGSSVPQPTRRRASQARADGRAMRDLHSIGHASAIGGHVTDIAPYPCKELSPG